MSNPELSLVRLVNQTDFKINEEEKYEHCKKNGIKFIPYVWKTVLQDDIDVGGWQIVEIFVRQSNEGMKVVVKETDYKDGYLTFSRDKFGMANALLVDTVFNRKKAAHHYYDKRFKISDQELDAEIKALADKLGVKPLEQEIKAKAEEIKRAEEAAKITGETNEDKLKAELEKLKQELQEEKFKNIVQAGAQKKTWSRKKGAKSKPEEVANDNGKGTD